MTRAERTFGQDVAFLERHRRTLVLSAPDGQAKIAIVPELQGRVMTSTARGDAGASHGFIHAERVASRVLLPGINAYGGEDRLWIGPEGGPFSFFFPPGAPAQTLVHWQTPPLVDSQAWVESEQTASSVRFARAARLGNAAGSAFELGIERRLVLLDAPTALAQLGLDPAGLAREGLAAVAHESQNRLTNAGRAPWTRTTGMPSLWIIGMFKPSPRAVAVLPLRAAPGCDLAGLVNDAYFGRVPAERLRHVPCALPATSALLFRADGRQRGKIGVAPAAALALAAGLDLARGVLTLVSFTLPREPRPYVNSQWGLAQAVPFAGDAVNAYNDGPSAPGAAPFGPFYELESSSPAAALAPGESLAHVHRTLHLEGPPGALEHVTRAVLGLSLAEIEAGADQGRGEPTP